jgi:hypothetical protein
MSKAWRCAFLDVSNMRRITMHVTDVAHCDRMSITFLRRIRNLSIGKSRFEQVDVSAVLYTVKYCRNLYAISVQGEWHDACVRREPAAFECAFKSAAKVLAHVRKLHIMDAAFTSRATLNRFVGACTTLEVAHVHVNMQFDFGPDTEPGRALRKEFLASLSVRVRELRSNICTVSDLQPLIAIADRGVRLQRLSVPILSRYSTDLQITDMHKVECEHAELHRKHSGVKVETDAQVGASELPEFLAILRNCGIQLRSLHLTNLITLDTAYNNKVTNLNRIRAHHLDTLHLSFVQC